MVLNDIKLKVFWSHNYAPLDSFIILRSGAGVWHAIPDQHTGRLITVALGESEKRAGYVEYWVEVLAKYQIIEPQAFAIINLSEEPKKLNK